MLAPTNDLHTRLESAYALARDFLQSERIDEHWVGELSTSALSTATAVSALDQARRQGVVCEADRVRVESAIQSGCQWLAEHQNNDGGFGDTDRSHSNIATTYLVIAAWELAGFGDAAISQQLSSQQLSSQQPSSQQPRSQQLSALQYVEANGKWDGLRRRYGKDKTFVVPILANCALAGLVPWKEVPPLPFEAAWLPQQWYRLAQMPVVSYAIPALVAIGQARFHYAPPKNPLFRWLRSQAIQPTLRVLRNMQPTSGGYLEAVPLTSFVLMSVTAAGNGKLPVAQECLRFILESRLKDGSWPIDTNLATWVTSLSINALSRRRGVVSLNGAQPAAAPANAQVAGPPLVTARTVRWLLRCQHKQRHPFTGATPGGWGWTDLSGAVPDADDTPAALLALSQVDLTSPAYNRLRAETLSAVANGLKWLWKLQNRNGGWPTFCRGWGKLPFDRSGTDLTAHALRAFHTWFPRYEELKVACGGGLPTRRQISRSMQLGMNYLNRTQQPDGSWLPLWFGNQDRIEEDNPIYGTGKVLLAYSTLGMLDSMAAQSAIGFLQRQQNPDGGWGGGASVNYQTSTTGQDFSKMSSSIEETAIALEALLLCGGDPGQNASIMRGLEWLATVIQAGNLGRSWPIGFYFAKLWYHERLYPTLFSLGALGAALRAMCETDTAAQG